MAVGAGVGDFHGAIVALERKIPQRHPQSVYPRCFLLIDRDRLVAGGVFHCHRNICRAIIQRRIGEANFVFTRGGELYLARRIEVSLAQLIEADAGRRNQYFERIALELQRSLDHFDRQYHYVTVAKLLLAPMPQEIGLQQYLAANIYVPVESIDLGAVMAFPGVPELKHPARQAQCLFTIGAALRGEEKAAA